MLDADLRTRAAAARRRSARRADTAPASPAPLLVAELRLAPEALATHLVERLEAGDTLDAFLLAAGLRQVAEDVLEPNVLRVADLERVLGGRAGAAARTAAAATAAVRTGPRELVAWDARLGRLLDGLADALVAGGDPAGRGPTVAETRALAAALPDARGLRTAVSRLPTAFQGIDQHPEDVRRLVERLLTQALPGPVVVVGLRTSGSYLAPLTAAWLRAAGHAAAAITLRPGVPLPAAKRRLLRSAGTVVLTDDPPASGGSLADAAREVERLGGRGQAIVVAVQLLAGDGTLPPKLLRHRSVVLPWEAWSVHERLRPAAVAATLRELCPERRFDGLERVALPDASGRGHCAARFRAADGEDVFVRGVGLGYFGHHALAVERALRGWVPASFGVADGLLYRPWLPEERRADGRRGDLPAQIARYAAVRRRRLAVPADHTERLGGQDPVWEVASNLVSQAFARGWRPMRLLAVDAAMREILRPGATSVVDGRMVRQTWFVAGDGRSLLKVAAAERAFSNRNLASADAAFDVAGAAAAWPEHAAQLREAFARESGEWIDEERWLLLRLVALWALGRDGEASAHDVKRASARALQDYFAAVYLDDVPRVPAGPLCTLDLDGVLETETLGYPGLSPAGALALRALLAHGHRPVIVSGRSVGEVAERCRAYGLAAGVAEYGAAVCGPGDAAPRSLLSAAAAAGMERTRAALAALGVEIGPDHRHAVRAWSRDGGGARTRLSPAAVAAACAAAAPVPLRAVEADAHTDLVPAEVDKGTGVRALLDALGEPGARPALAIGDQVADLPMLALAEQPMAPANAAAGVRHAGTRVLRLPYQAGVAQAVGAVLGHPPGGCPACRLPPADRRRRLLLGILAARERGRPGLAIAAVRAGLLAHRP